jgi:hypothetical protein
MQLHSHQAKLSAIRAFSAPIRCPYCGDWMVAPISSEFVEGGEIRHHWECDGCGEFTSSIIQLTAH